MPYNETFEKLKAAQSPEFAEEIVAVRDNQTFFIGGYENTPEGNVPKGDFNEIFQALLNNDKALKKLAEAIQARTITAGKGLQGGGSLATDRTIDVVSADDSITVGADNIKVNTYNGVDGTSTTRPGSAAAVKQAFDEAAKMLPHADVPEGFNSAAKIVTALQANGGLRFDPGLLYLNDAGTKRVGYCYLDRLQEGIFECKAETTTTVNDASKFKNISNKSNSDRLDNLITIENVNSKEFLTGVYGSNSTIIKLKDITLITGYVVASESSVNTYKIVNSWFEERNLKILSILGTGDTTSSSAHTYVSSYNGLKGYYVSGMGLGVSYMIICKNL